MTDNAKAKEQQAKAETQLTNDSRKENTKLLSLRPLPQNRPIATNESEGINALLGYLD